MDSQMNSRIVLRNDTTANWEKNKTCVLLRGEIGIEFLTNGQAKIKIGDGVSTWAALPYFGIGGSVIMVVLETILELGETHYDAIQRIMNGQVPSIGNIVVVKEVVSDKIVNSIAYVFDGTNWLATSTVQDFNNNIFVYDEDGLIGLTGFSEATIGAHLVKGDNGTLVWEQPKEEVVFETEYNAETNKAATMADVKASVLGLSGAMHFKGVKDELPVNNSEYVAGDVVLVGKKEYVYDSEIWHELGDENIVVSTKNIVQDEGDVIIFNCGTASTVV